MLFALDIHLPLADGQTQKPSHAKLLAYSIFNVHEICLGELAFLAISHASVTKYCDKGIATWIEVALKNFSSSVAMIAPTL
jgi:hypothetical protein